MIRDSFYPTATDMSFMGLKYTAELQSIPIPENVFTQAYWLGWMGWKKLPMQYHVSAATFADGVLSLTDNTKPENVPVGFSVHYSSNLDIYKWGCSFVKYKDANTKWGNIDWVYSSTAANYFYLPNMLNINTCTWGRLRLIFYGLSEDRTTELNYVSADVPYEDFAAGSDMTVTVSNAGVYNGTFTVTKTDISQYSTFTKTINNVTFNFVLAAYTIPCIRDVNYNSGVQGYSSVHPMVQIHNKSNRPYIIGITNPVQFQFRDDTYWGSGGYQGQGFYCTWSGALNGLTAYNNNGVYDWCGGFIGTINMSDMPQGQLFLTVPTDATFYCRGVGRSDYFIVGRVLTYDEVLHCLSLLPRMRNTDTGIGYAQDSSYWYGHVNYDTNEFLGDLVNGSQLNKLVDWQLLNHNIDDNTVTVDDIPEYNPIPGDAENVGEKITRPATLGIGGTNGFVTLYALRKADIAQLGELLWTSFVDTDYWKNYLFSLALDTGTFSLAGLLNFFVSCRVYPFSMANVAGCSSFGQDMYVGTGIVPLHFTTNLHTLGSMCDYIYGGWYEIPRCYNDWRDYVNTEIILYIPYCGTLKLNPGDVVGNRIDITYAVDFATGGCIAYVDMTTGDGQGFPVGALPGQIGADIPLTATAAGEVAARFIGDALNVGGIVAGEGANVASGALGAAMGKPSAGGGNFLSGTAGIMGGLPAAMAVDMAVPMAKQGLQMLSRGAVQAPMLSGGRGFASFGAPQKPYVQIRRGIYPEISGLDDIAGKPAAVTTTIEALTGFVQGDVKTDGLSCPENEKAKIRQLIASGIYV